METWTEEDMTTLDKYLQFVCKNNEKCQNCACYHPKTKICFLAYYCVAFNFKAFQKKRQKK